MDKKEEEIKNIEQFYKEQSEAVYKARGELISGTRDPLPLELEKLEEYKDPITTNEEPNIDIEQLEATNGLPEFWFKAMNNSTEITPYIEEVDEPILKHLTNIKYEPLENNV